MKSVALRPAIGAVVGLVLCSGVAVAQDAALVPSHCKDGESAWIDARMSEVHYHKGGGYHLVRSDKVLSLCADRAAEPFDRVAYRFGPIGRPEMERIATASSRFRVFDRSTSPHTGENLVFFTAGPFTYCISEATGQGNGIGLTVLKSGRRVLELFSGNERGTDFEADRIDVDFESTSSPALQRVPPSSPLRTACDPRRKP